MTSAAVDALRADHGALVNITTSLSDEQWSAPSGCAGWAVRDVVGHMTQLFRQVVDPGGLPPPDPSLSTERTQERWVEAMRQEPVERLVADYRTLGDQAIGALAGMQGNDTVVDLGDLGRHPLHLIANAFAFDHYAHIRVDLFAPAGPLGADPPPADERHLEAAADWIVAGIPQMSPDAVTQPVELVVTGPGGRTAHLARTGRQSHRHVLRARPRVVEHRPRLVARPRRQHQRRPGGRRALLRHRARVLIRGTSTMA